MDRMRERDEEKVKENLEGTQEPPDNQDRPYTPPSGKTTPNAWIQPTRRKPPEDPSPD